MMRNCAEKHRNDEILYNLFRLNDVTYVTKIYHVLLSVAYLVSKT